MINFKKMGVYRLGVFSVALLTVMSCEGPVGPPGPPGSDGLDGIVLLGEVFELEANFNAQGSFGVLGEYGFEIEESDKVLIYHLDGVEDNRDIWRLLPRVVFHPNGIFNYSFDFTRINFSIFLEGDFDLNTLEPGYLQGQIFRVLIIPADFLPDGRVDLSDHEGMLRMMDVNPADIPRITLK
ncbi:hypothetical protein [Lunatibacter salilacus]|uniref:hypothetical protein n=1 Tax=Lunatibacter salilacus TaxID=2483804 RepID=UPI001F2A7647|nr:hypothetical protein [Lunatibacter salilacus]